MELESLIKQVRVPARHLVHNWQGDAGCADSCLLARLMSNSDQFFVYVASGSEEVERVANELRFFGQPESDVLTFPEWETLPYDAFSPHDDLISERLSTSFELLRANKGALVVSVRSLLQCMPPSRFVRSQSFLFKSGQHFDIQLERQRLIQTGYRHVELVMERGEFAVRGSIMDIFPMGSDRPIRV
ncbi:MAG: transcription-repair coupling factor, partial [Pseudomonadales bacterium]|nr:transcription-repair coupling factor [Pseudomonadales bacterium]